MDRFICCPVCGEQILSREYERFGMCLECFADSISSNVSEGVLYDFLREYGSELRRFIMESTEDCYD